MFVDRYNLVKMISNESTVSSITLTPESGCRGILETSQILTFGPPVSRSLRSHISVSPRGKNIRNIKGTNNSNSNNNRNKNKDTKKFHVENEVDSLYSALASINTLRNADGNILIAGLNDSNDSSALNEVREVTNQVTKKDSSSSRTSKSSRLMTKSTGDGVEILKLRGL